MSDYLSRRVEARENIEILYNAEIRKMSGGKELEQSNWKIRKTARAPSCAKRRRCFP